MLALLAPLTMRAWFDEDLLPSGDAAGYMSMVDHVRDSLLRYRRVPAWSTKWFAGSTHFMSSLKELATFPLALELGPVLATKAMFVVSKVAAALGMYSLFVRYFSAPLPGIIAGYAYGFGAPANHSNALFGHLDVAMSYALFPVILMASVELLRARRWRWAIALGVLVAGQLCIHYLHAIVCPLLLLVVLGLRPWRRTAHEDDPVADRALARRWGRLLGGSLVTFVLFAGSPLAWLVADRGNHALHSPEQVAQGVERYVEQSPFLYVNRNNWLGDWVERHRPPQMLFSASDPDFNSRRYLGVVAIAVAAGGWLCARRRFSLRRWYQSFGLVFLLQYWLATGPRTPVWQIARSLHWANAVDGPVSAGLTLAAVGCLVWAILLVLRRRAPAVRVELAVGLALFLFLLSHSLFDLARGALPFLRVIRSPGHLFDLAPFTFYGLFGVGLVAITRATARASARHGLAAALGLAVVLDFWPSTHAFSRGTPLGRVREFRRVVSELPAEGGTLRLAMSPSSPTGWTAPSLVAAGSEVGTAWSWIFWQAGRYWGDYLRIATLPHVRRLTPETRERVREIGDVLCRIGRLKYLLEEVEFPSRLRMEAPWTRRAANPRFVLWERPEVMPMAYGYRSYVVAGGRADSAGTVFWAFQRELLVVSGEEHSSHVPPAVLDGAALVADEEPVEDAEERIARAPRGRLLPVDYRRPAPEHIVLRTDSGDAPAMIFLSESYHPWWQAVVDGRPAPLVRAQMVFMAVPVGPGPHLIELRLRRPLPVAAADWITAVAWLALPLAAAGGVLRRRTGRRTVSAPSALTRRFL